MIGIAQIDAIESMIDTSKIHPSEWCDDNGVDLEDLLDWATMAGAANERNPRLQPASAVCFGFQVGFECGKQAAANA